MNYLKKAKKFVPKNQLDQNSLIQRLLQKVSCFHFWNVFKNKCKQTQFCKKITEGKFQIHITEPSNAKLRICNFFAETDKNLKTWTKSSK